jgi:hypothetical protein
MRPIRGEFFMDKVRMHLRSGHQSDRTPFSVGAGDGGDKDKVEEWEATTVRRPKSAADHAEDFKLGGRSPQIYAPRQKPQATTGELKSRLG